MNDFYVEFEVVSEDRYQSLDAVVSALADAKRDDDFKDGADWLPFFDDEALSHFWWPTKAERDDDARRWDAAPVEVRLNDPSLDTGPWDFESMLDAFRNGDYELLGCQRISTRLGRLTFNPFGWPFGGTGCMRALIESFGHRVTDERG